MGCLAALVLMVGVSLASASTNVLMMPDRQAFEGSPIVVWGRTTHPNGSACTLDFGDTTSVNCGPVVDRTYIASTHTYANAGTFTAKLTVAGESETAVITVLDPATLTDANKRGSMINQAIEDAKRFIYFNQSNRTAVSNTQSWYIGDNARQISYTSLAVLSLENHGHQVNNDPTKDIYQDTVQRGLNFIFDRLSTVNLTVEPAGDPCVGGIGPGPCTGLAQTVDFPTGYSTSIAALAVAAAAASDPTRLVAAGLGVNNGFFVAGKQYSEILQRQVSTIVWAAADSGFNQGGWRYGLDDNQSDGSAIGWAVLALLDGAAAGATVPAFAASELAVVIQNTSCPQPSGDLTNGLSYAGCGNGNVLRTGIALQALHLMGKNTGNDPRVNNAANYISTRWNSPSSEDFICFEGSLGLGTGSPSGSRNNKGCSYAMFQVFKGLKLQGINLLSGVNRPASVLVDPANPPNLMPRVGDVDDWHLDYQDYLVANQQNPTAPTGGNWAGTQLGWSCCEFAATPANNGVTALALLILSPTPLILPAQIVLEPATATNIEGESHTVTATVTNTDGSPSIGTTVTFTITGPNAAESGSTAVTGADGKASFTYIGDGGLGTDKIVASVGNIQSNEVEKTWIPANEPPDCSNAAASPSALWPPNHKFVNIAITGVTDPDGDPVTITPTSVFQDEPVIGPSSGNTTPDAQLSPLAVRAERNGDPKTPGNGRVYHITFTASDGEGGTCTGEVTVCVPHDQRPGSTCVDGGPLYNSIP